MILAVRNFIKKKVHFSLMFCCYRNHFWKQFVQNIIEFNFAEFIVADTSRSWCWVLKYLLSGLYIFHKIKRETFLQMII